PAWRDHEALDVDALTRIGESVASDAPTRVHRLLEALVAFRVYRRSQTGTDKKRARVLALALRDEVEDEPIAWALHRALTRPPTARDIHGVFRIVRADIKRKCAKPSGSDAVKLTLRIEPRSGRAAVTNIAGGGDALTAFRACARARVEALRYQAFVAEPLDGTELTIE
ncbi:MAG: hypothetical protein KC468_30540, partial [Myxococcales bacterium]|nr:hypothetical protein [Myxococcales bacterium]